MKIYRTILILLIALLALPAVAMADVIGKITAFEGNVDILRRGQERAAPVVRLEEPVSEGDILRTKSNGKAEITFIDESIIRLAPGSRLQITEYLMDGGKRKSGVMNLFRGKVRAVVSKSRGFLSAAFGGDDRFEVRTPTAVAGVKGTNFFVSYIMGVTGIVVTDGKVDVFNPAIPGQIVRVTEGNGTFVAENKPPSPPRPANDVEIIRHTKDTDTSEKPKENKDDETITTQTTADAGEDVFGYEAPGDIKPPLADAGGLPTTNLLPISETNLQVLAADTNTSPLITVTGPASLTNSNLATFTVTFNEPVSATYTMGSFGATTTNTTSDTFSIASLPEGSNTLTVTATDSAGNITTTTYLWTTDYTAPASLTLTGTPASITNINSATISATATDTNAITYSYSLDGAPSIGTLTGLAEGSHIFIVTATDSAGNITTTTYLWTTDYTAPASLTLTGTPASITNINSATISATATDTNAITYSYSLDGAPSTGTLTGLSEGPHTFVATATDGAGNISTTSYTWTTDYIAPTASIASRQASPETGATAAINVNLASNETSAFSYQLDGGPLTSTGSVLSLPGVAEGTHTINYTATDAAGNPSAPASLSFDLSRYSLSGNVSADLLGGFGSVTSGEVAGISSQNWGGWSMDMAGIADTGIPPAFTMVAGGTSTDTLISNNGGYWIEIINGSSDGVSVLSGTSSLKYLSFDRLGTGTGIMAGSYNGLNWLATDKGTYTETRLAFSGNIGYDQNDWGLYTVDGFGINGIGDSFGGLLGGIVPSLSNPASITYIGPYNDFFANLPAYIWTPVIYSGNGSFAYAPSYDSNEFWGYIGGTFQNGAIAGRVYSLYIDPLGNAGILRGSLAGAYYPALSMLQADGTWTPIQIATGVLQSALVDLTYSAGWTWSSDFVTSFTSSGDFTSGGIPLNSPISVVVTEGRRDSITGGNWGIWQTIIGGDYISPVSPYDGWNLSSTVFDSLFGSIYITGMKTDGTIWLNGILAGQTYGYGADITTTPNTWISVGETIGTFDATALTWQAVQTGAWLDTNKFLAMTQTGAGQAALTALNIPFAEVGRANLSGTGTIGGATATAAMNNVTFFAYNTGAAPKIWATGDVQGTYTCSACGPGSIPVAGNGLSANFNIQTFDTAGQKWIATVNGSGTYTGTGTMNNTNVQMTGAAAGGINTAGPGTFSGTGAGVVK